ncbi:hypothetical protein FB45DRAFT_169729 [Roridomyces roridus]|uniref:Uncharacterized protein n=1 Tax=Roridomyces roridus TaxID=1738132 RepID=A0AAD7FH98_9AGAR|nr:hypothetical protein FB45DRAFT_169729 [Roridomyces roridus]
MSFPIVYTFSQHLDQVVDQVPAAYADLNAGACPIGALLLSIQAAQRSMELWKTGELVIPKRPDTSGQFSFDNYGDKRTREGGIVKLVRRASKYLATVNNWDDNCWEVLYAEAAHWKGHGKKKSGRTSAAATPTASEAETVEQDEDGDLIILSD